MRRGSVALEFLLVVLAIAVYIAFTVKAVQVIALQSADDLSRMVRTRAAMTKIYNAVSFLAQGADGTTTTISVYVPQGVDMTLSGNTVKAVVSTEGNLANLPNCTDKNCTFTLRVPLNFDASYTLSTGIVNVRTFSRKNGEVHVS